MKQINEQQIVQQGQLPSAVFALRHVPSSGSCLQGYPSKPEALAPEHCGLCKESFPCSAHSNPQAAKLAHLRERHADLFQAPLSDADLEEAYRDRVLRGSVALWPQPVTPSLLRSRITGYRESLSKEKYKQLPCAVCAFPRLRRNLHRVVLPTRDDTTLPAWLRSPPNKLWTQWSEDTWSEQHPCDVDRLGGEVCLTGGQRFFEKLTHLFSPDSSKFARILIGFVALINPFC